MENLNGGPAAGRELLRDVVNRVEADARKREALLTHLAQNWQFHFLARAEV